MKILFIGPYRQDDGWGHASRSFLKSLCMTDHDISSAPVYLNRQKEYRSFDDDFMLSSESNRNENYDVVIQNCLPHMFRQYGGVKNIGISFFESSIKNTPWPNSIHLMDRMWVSSSFEKQILEQASVTNVDIVPIPSDINIIDQEFEYKKLIERTDDDFIFYFVGENTTRKNISALIKAFHLEFKPYEQVELVLKVNNVGMSDEETLEDIKKLIYKVKGRLGLYKDVSMYKSEHVITRFLSENDLRGIHKDCDCFVMPSSGEGFCIPAFDAMLHGSSVIANANCSIADYIYNGENGILVHSKKVPAVAVDRPLSFLYNGRDYWYEVDVEPLRLAMRKEYDNRLKNKTKILEFSKRNIIPFYSFDRVAESMNVALGKL